MVKGVYLEVPMLSVKGFLLSLNGENYPDTISCYFHLATATHIGLGWVGQQDERDYKWGPLSYFFGSPIVRRLIYQS